jgi:hypothetical protein
LFKEKALTPRARRQTCALYSSRNGCNLRKAFAVAFTVALVSIVFFYCRFYDKIAIINIKNLLRGKL